MTLGGSAAERRWLLAEVVSDSEPVGQQLRSNCRRARKGARPTYGAAAAGVRRLIPLLIALAASVATADAGTHGRYEQRMAYADAVRALEARRLADFRKLQDSLADYPLAPYLVWREAARRVGSIRPAEMGELRESMQGIPAGERLFRSWLRAQAQSGRWSTYLAHYEPVDDATMRCYHLRALYRSGEREAALDQVQDLWVSPVSQPKACDPLFDVWRNAGRIDDETAWARLTAALEAGQTGLGRYILRFFQEDADVARLYHEAHTRPSIVARGHRFPRDAKGNQALAHGLMRHSRRHPRDTRALWHDYRDQRDFDEETRRKVTGAIALSNAKAGNDVQASPAEVTAEGAREVALQLIRDLRWRDALVWTAALPQEDERWLYWHGRLALDLAPEASTGADGAEDAARVALQAAAQKRSYYGFLAAQRLGIESRLNEQRPEEAGSGNGLQDLPAALRLVELYAVGDLLNARREWNALKGSLDEERLALVLERMHEVGWINQAIAGAWQAQLPDLLHVRFPQPFPEIYRRHAFTTNLPHPMLLAVSRQESAFDHRAVSRAGARGLMQLMPATARIVARRIRAARPSEADLFDPEVNIRLGSNHLAFLMDRYDGHRALVFAAYNAGEHRSDRWKRKASGMPTEAWIERIPFRETRDYVKSVLAFQHVYALRAGTSPPMLADHELLIP
ncbi:MAG: transglycosylase SLT domain-containing protein [Gammaproteobacteria bacterium]|nr:transglycosylase SLT domain-containing protein [Gammaproteobacteria bacterium]